MKKTILVSGLICLVIIACSRNTVATKEPVIPKREDSITPITTENNSGNSSTSSVAVDEATIPLGKTVYETKCGRCHGLKNVSNYSEHKWVVIMKQMAPKAKLTEAETQQIAAYVQANAKK